MSSSKTTILTKKHLFWLAIILNLLMNFMLTILSDPKSLPKSWRQFFDGLSEEQKLIYNDLQGPSWSPERKNKKINLHRWENLESRNEKIKMI